MPISKLISFVIALLIVLPMHLAKSEPRFALVIGNSNYANTTFLKNPVNDAQLMAQTLENAGFEVSLTLDADLKTMKRALIAFSQTMKEKNEAGLLYYAGHGLQVDGENYLVPIDAVISNEEEIPIETIRVNDFLFMMEKSTSDMKIIILDACRNNPFARSFRSTGGGGLAIINAPRGSYIAYATSPGAVALDGKGQNSPFTKALAQSIAQPGLQIEEVFKLTRVQVLEATNDKQVPWDTTSITGNFYFNARAENSQPEQNVGVLNTSKKKPLISKKDWERVSNLLHKPAIELRQREAKASWAIMGGVYDKAILQDFVSRYAGTPQADEALIRISKIDTTLNNRLISKVGSKENVRIATFDKWSVFHRDTDNGKACVSAAQPEMSDDPNVKWLFVESFVNKNGKDFRRWFSVNIDKVGRVGKAVLVVDGKKFPLKVRQSALGATIILQNSAIVDALMKGSEAWLNLVAKDNKKTAARFSLKGVSAALGKMDLVCVTFFSD